MHKKPFLIYRLLQFIDVARNEGIAVAMDRTRNFFAARLQCVPKEITSGRPLDVVFVSGCPGPSERYRVHNILAGLRELGYSGSMLPASLFHGLQGCRAPAILVLFRCCEKYGLEMKPIIAEMRNKGSRIVCDHDDLVFDPDIIAEIDGVRYLSKSRQNAYRHDVLKYQELIGECDVGTATTPFLAERMQQHVSEVWVIPNSVDKAQLEIAECLVRRKRRPNDRLEIIYASGTKTHQKDFLQCADALACFLRNYNARFIAVGLLDLPACLQNFGEKVVKKPFLPYLKLLETIADCDINIAPLENTVFNHAKSELKIFEAGLVGVPTIASPTDCYARCIEHGKDGMLADSPADWSEALILLASSSSLRVEMGSRMRKKTLSLFSYKRAATIAAETYGLPEK